MRTTPELLAAVATAAVPGVTPVATGPSPDDQQDFDACVVRDAQDRRWRVRSPRHPEASMRLETEHLVLRAFTPSVRAHLPFHMPSVVGSVEHHGLRTFVYSHWPGGPLSLAELEHQHEHPQPGHRPPSAEPRPALAVQIGRAIAAIHSLPRALVMDSDLPAYSAEQCRARMLHDLDRAAATGRVPGQLLRRWELALEDTTLWRFSTRVVHAALHEENITVHDGALASITGWSDLHVGDPARDFAWLVGMNGTAFADTVLEAYSVAAVQPPDRHVLRRAHLVAEFALAEWLVRGVDRGSQRAVADAERMLATLERDVQRTGSPAPGITPERDADHNDEREHEPPVAGPAGGATAPSGPASGLGTAAATGSTAPSGSAATSGPLPDSRTTTPADPPRTER